MQKKPQIISATRSILQRQGEYHAANFLVSILFANIQDKAGAPYYGHLARVAAGVPDHVKPAALMHDLVEDIPGWSFDDLKTIGFSDRTIAAVRAVTKDEANDEKYFDAMERVGRNADAVYIKRSDLKDNANLFRLNRLPLQKDFNRVAKYFLADKYLADIQGHKTAPGTSFHEWMQSKPADLQNQALLKKESSPKF